MSDYRNRRQRSAYKSRVDVYTEDKGVLNRKSFNNGWTRVYTDVPALYGYTKNIDYASGVGMIRYDILDTTDALNLPYYHDRNGQEVELTITAGMWVINTTPRENLPHGAAELFGLDAEPAAPFPVHPLFGDVHKIVGAPFKVPGGNRRMVLVQKFQISQEENPPDELAEAFTKDRIGA